MLSIASTVAIVLMAAISLVAAVLAVRTFRNESYAFSTLFTSAALAAPVLLVLLNGSTLLVYAIYALLALMFAILVAYKNSAGVRKLATLGIVAAFGLVSMGAATDSPTTLSVLDAEGNVVEEWESIDLSTDVSSDPPDDGKMTVHYYAYEAEEGTNQFGPRISLANADDGIARLNEKMFSDPLFTSAVLLSTKYGREVTDDSIMELARTYEGNHTAWKRASTDYLDNWVKSARLADAGPVPYYSLGMIPGSDPSEMPQITQFSEQPSLGQVLILEIENGENSSTLYLRVDCDLQPAFKSKVPNVSKPAVKESKPKQEAKPYGGGQPPKQPWYKKPPQGGGNPPPPTTKTPPTSEPPTSEPPTSEPPEPCVPEESGECKDPDAGPDAPDEHPGAGEPTEPADSELPDEPNPNDPDVPTDAPVEPEETRTEVPEPIETGAPTPDEPGTGGVDPDGDGGVGIDGSGLLHSDESSNADTSNADTLPSQAPAPSAPADEAPAEVMAPADVIVEPMSYSQTLKSNALKWLLIAAATIGACVFVGRKVT